MTQRFTRKPLIGAIRGYALGGGCEMVMNLDIAVAGEGATFGFPEVKRGVVILAGGLERFVKLVGHQRGECSRRVGCLGSRMPIRAGLMGRQPEEGVRSRRH